MDWRTEKYNNNVNIKYNKNGLLKTKKLHAVLVSDIPTLNSSICKKSFQNRDRNSVLNIRKLTHYYLETKERIERYKRGIKLSNWVGYWEACGDGYFVQPRKHHYLNVFMLKYNNYWFLMSQFFIGTGVI